MIDVVHDLRSQWTDLLTVALREHGADQADAEQTATLIVAAVEGSVAICRVERSTRALDRISAKLENIVSETITRTDRGH
ncbi:LmrA/YxaF family transcription factor [Nocardia niwae]|uniref:LmrA/YxaF family transcription factor n=1 Tax=Nocardia niwae TaxID=626084 RepID=UPI0033EF44E1